MDCKWKELRRAYLFRDVGQRPQIELKIKRRLDPIGRAASLMSMIHYQLSITEGSDAIPPGYDRASAYTAGGRYDRARDARPHTGPRRERG